MRTSILHIDTLTSAPIPTPGAQVYIRSQAVQVRIPAIHGGLIWNRPVASVVRTPDGQERIIPILDITRIILFTLAGFCFTSFLLLIFLRRGKFRS
jgi:hypothetical protein